MQRTQRTESTPPFRPRTGASKGSFALLFAAAALFCGAAGCARTARPPARGRPSGPSPGRGIGPQGRRREFGDLFSGIDQMIQNFSGKSPGYYARQTLSESPDARDAGIEGLVEKKFGKGPPYTERYKDLAENDTDYLVRATALRALNRSRDKTATPLFVKALGDPNAKVRLEACKALVNLPDPAASEPLLNLMNKPDEDKDVRIAAADALRHYKKLEVARGLVSMLGERDFGVAFQARKSLKRLTGRDLRYDETAWLEFITGPEKPFG